MAAAGQGDTEQPMKTLGGEKVTFVVLRKILFMLLVAQ